MIMMMMLIYAWIAKRKKIRRNHERNEKRNFNKIKAFCFLTKIKVTLSLRLWLDKC